MWRVLTLTWDTGLEVEMLEVNAATQVSCLGCVQYSFCLKGPPLENPIFSRTEKYWLHRGLLSWSDLTLLDLHTTMGGNWMLL